jgi:hypothetical protein
VLRENIVVLIHILLLERRSKSRKTNYLYLLDSVASGFCHVLFIIHLAYLPYLLVCLFLLFSHFKINSCKVLWRLTLFLFLFNNPVVSSANIVKFVKLKVLAFLIPPKAAVKVK